MKPAITALKIGITALKKSADQRHRWQKTFNQMFDGHPIPTYFDNLETALINILGIIYNDPDLLWWWIYETDFGKKTKEGSLIDKKGNNIPIKTVNDLYLYYKKYTLNKKKSVKISEIAND